MNGSNLEAGGRSQDRTADSYRVKIRQNQPKVSVTEGIFGMLGAKAGIRRGLKIPAVALFAALSACAGSLPPDAFPKQVARAECTAWLGQHNLAQRPRRGTVAWDQLVELCVAKNRGAAGEIDRALEGRS